MATQASMIAIQQDYIAYYGRPADFAGQTYWAGVLDQDGGRLDGIIQSFGNSAESTTLYGGSTTAQRIEKIYQQLFNRAPDEAGKNWWAGEIEAGRVTLQSAALQILNGATNDDMLIIQRKTSAGEQFTEALRSKNMSHAYTEADISAARGFLSGITLGMTSTELSAHVDLTLLDVYKASWISFAPYTVPGSYWLGSAAGMAFFNDGLIFGGSASKDYYSEMNIYLTTLNESLQPDKKISIGHAEFDESLQGMAKNGGNGLVLWGDLDSDNSSSEANFRFIWTIDENLKPVAEARIGTVNGNAPYINKVVPLSNGKILVVGAQNNFGDGLDAFAIVFNSDLTVHAQRRFDSPKSVGGTESFFNAIELSGGDLVLVGGGGEFFRVNQSLQQTGLARDFNVTKIYNLKDDLMLIHEGDIYHVVNSNFDRLASFYDGIFMRGLVEKSPGQFIAHVGAGVFFDLNIDFNKVTGKVEILSQEGKQLVSRSGSGISPQKYVTVDDAIMAVSGNDLFVFDLNIPATPNLALDYRVIQSAVNFGFNDTSYNYVVRPDWISEDMQIVTVGTVPDFGVEQSIIANQGISFI